MDTKTLYVKEENKEIWKQGEELVNQDFFNGADNISQQVV